MGGLKSWGIVVLVALTSGCAAAPPSDGTGLDRLQREQGQRLVGRWRLERYTPATSLGKVLMSNILKEAIVVAFDGSRVRSSASGMRLDRRYSLEPVGPSSFRITVFDEHGVAQSSIGTYRGTDQVLFVSNNPPWAGTGTLSRIVAKPTAAKPTR
jgi:hypothetical protein